MPSPPRPTKPAKKTAKSGTRKKARTPRPVIGWREWVALPDFGVDAVKAKVDTGARTSSLHAFSLKEFERDGERWVRFVIHPEQKRARPAIQVEAPLIDRRAVRNSGGREETRPVIEALIGVGAERWPVEITLTRRDAMGFRMLLGRQAIRGRFTVDPGASYLAGKRPRTPASSPSPPSPSESPPSSASPSPSDPPIKSPR